MPNKNHAPGDTLLVKSGGGNRRAVLCEVLREGRHRYYRVWLFVKNTQNFTPTRMLGEAAIAGESPDKFDRGVYLALDQGILNVCSSERARRAADAATGYEPPKPPPSRSDPPDLGDCLTLAEEEPGYLLGTIMLFGTHFHVEAVRVKPAEVGSDVEAWGRNDQNFIRVQRAAEFIMQDDPVRPHHVRIPGRPGEWLLWITPYCD